MSTFNFQILPPFPTSCSGAQQWNPLTILLTLTSHKAQLFLIAFPSFPWPGFHSHAFLVLSLLLLAYPLFCIIHITLSFWTTSSNSFEGLPYLHPTCSSHNLLCYMPLGQVSNLNGTVTDYPFPKTKEDVFGPNPGLICISLALLISGEGCRLQAAEQLTGSFAQGDDCTTSHWELRSSHYPSNGYG